MFYIMSFENLYNTILVLKHTSKVFLLALKMENLYQNVFVGLQLNVLGSLF